MNAQKSKVSGGNDGAKGPEGISASPKVSGKADRVRDPEEQKKLNGAFWKAIEEAICGKGAAGECLDSIKRLLKAGADVDARKEGDVGTSILVPVSKEDEKDASSKFLPCSLRRIASADGTESRLFSEFFFPEYSGTALMWAAFDGQKEIAQMLIDAGADVNAKDADGSTVLMHAVSGGERETVKLLLDAGADVNARDDRYHGTALMVAKIHTKVDGLSVQLEL